MNSIEIVNWHKKAIIKKIQDDIFSEEEWRWKESRSVAEADAKQDDAFVNGMKAALKIIEEYDPNKWMELINEIR